MYENLLHYNVGYEKCANLFSTIPMVILDRFKLFFTVGNRNEYANQAGTKCVTST